MRESLFSEQYYRELVYSHIDNINMLYVALTRASQSLHIFIKRDKIGIGRTIAKVLATPSESITLGQIEGTITTLDQTTTYTFGQKSAPLQEPDKKRQSRLYIMDSYPSAKADLRLRLPSQRYFEELEEGDADVEITPRHEGILMHQAFAEATTAADIVEQLATMQLNGKLSEQEHSSLKEKIDRALEQEPIKGWFSDQWERVYNERDIIIPHGSTFKRPDRVMVRGKEAVVVDYKFGQRETKAHLRQVEEYVTLLRQMGYKRCSGYVWYIKSGKIIASQL